jgi:membrane protease YdiL (CAAX protease family)
MLFAVKNHFLASLLVLAVFVAGGWFGRAALGLEWDLAFRPAYLGWGIAALAASDGLLHGLLVLGFGPRYRNCYRTLVEFFRPQGVPEILAGCLLAGGEEVFFRGLLLEGLRSLAGVGAAAAVAGAALAFGLLHLLPRRALLPFAAWAVWEGALLGWVYVASGSLLVTVVLHVLHDLAGFSLFAYQRRTGWFL